MTSPLLMVKDLKISFQTRAGTARAVAGIDFEVACGETLGIVGESGCGKSMIALSLLRLVPSPGRIESGEIMYKGQNLLKLEEPAMRRVRGKEISMVFQEPMTSLNPVLSCGNQIREVLRLHQNMSTRSARDRTYEIFEMVGIPSPQERARQYPHQLSGGLRQRVMIAMALACRPSLFIADEPSTALDVTVQDQILDLLRRLQQRLRMSIIMITHDFGVVAEIADRVMVLYAGRIMEQARTETLFLNPVHPYTKCLLKSIPRLEAEKGQLYTIQGAVPNVFDVPTGCTFHPRCPDVMPLCRESEPELKEHSDGHTVRCWSPCAGEIP